ncbi:chymotrypsinogen A-like [Panonychus citri]|uniref:chymotrypsinogen A-like n=1 Tax=Panonychus citri TaxID=50023 RepID=UPI0023075FA6|nr:chymotrypsinogen A-like [Panonychus citri]
MQRILYKRIPSRLTRNYQTTLSPPVEVVRQHLNLHINYRPYDVIYVAMVTRKSSLNIKRFYALGEPIVIDQDLLIFLTTECGLEGSISRIYRGQKTRPHKYPWLTKIHLYSDISSDYNGFCGGSLIDDQHVITAAHCVTIHQKETLNNPNNIYVYLGLSKTDTFNSIPKLVSKIWVHPKYKQSSLLNDIAILTLSRPVKFTQQIFPICLPNCKIDLDHLVTSGWGLTSPNGTRSEFLQEVDVSYLNIEECQRRQSEFFPNDSVIRETTDYYEIWETHICAINLRTQGGACSGDSGGPLMHKAKGLYYLVGLVSGSWEPCGPSVTSAGLYTRIDLYRDIIKSIAQNSCWKD